jgi:hypothetical protein
MHGTLSKPGVDTHTMPLCLHHGSTGYVTRKLLDRKQGMEVVATAFTDHFAVVIRLTCQSQREGEATGRWTRLFSLQQTSVTTCKSDGQPDENMAVCTRTSLCGGPATSKNRYGNTSYVKVPRDDRIVQSWKTSIMQPFMMLFEIPLTPVRPILHWMHWRQRSSAFIMGNPHNSFLG